MQYMMVLTAQNSQGTAGDQSCGGKVGEEVKDPYFMNIFIIIIIINNIIIEIRLMSDDSWI